MELNIVMLSHIPGSIAIGGIALGVWFGTKPVFYRNNVRYYVYLSKETTHALKHQLPLTHFLDCKPNYLTILFFLAKAHV